MTPARTSLTDPLRIAEIGYPGGGTIGVTLLPGKRQPAAMTGAWERDLVADVDVIRAWGADTIITLVERSELRRFGVLGLSRAVEAAGLRWLHLPVRDADIPDARWEAAWLRVGPDVHSVLVAGGKVLVHCRGGLGRAGTLAARLLIEAGTEPREAMRQVRKARPGAIETAAQEDYLLALRAILAGAAR
jgi:protein-tyrosine phosphatase